MNPNFLSIRASAKFRHQYPAIPQTQDVPASKFPLTWNLDILPNGRSQLLVLASEESSLYSLLIPVSRSKKGIAFILAFEERLAQLLPLKPRAVMCSLSNRTNRHVIGSQNELLFQAALYLQKASRPATPSELLLVESKLNSTYKSYLGRERPRDAFARLMQKLQQGGKAK